MPTSTEKSAQRLNTWIASSQCPDPQTLSFRSSPALDENGNPIFLTLFDDYGKYQQLTSWSRSQEERYAILTALNDIVFLRNFGYQKQKLFDILARPSFRLGVLRSATAYRALRRGWRSVQAEAVDSLSDARSEFHLTSQLHGYDEGIHDLKVQFTESGLFEDRIHSLIGVNGSGKTRLLRELILTQGRHFEELEGTRVFTEDDATEAISTNAYSGPIFNRIIVFSSDSEMRFPPATRNDTSFEYQHFNLTNTNGIEMGDRWVSGTDVRNQVSFLGSVVVDLLRDKENFTKTKDGVTRNRFELLREVMRNHVDMDALYLPLQASQDQSTYGVVKDESGNKWVRALDFLKMNEQRLLELSALVDEEAEIAFFTENANGSAIRQIYLSSGQKMFFRFALRLISSIDQGTLVVVDEPETHLHPNLICDVASLLYNVLTQMKSIAIIATHSAYVVREMPTHCVHVFNVSKNSKQVEIGRVRLKTLGASIDSISQAVFGDATVEKYHEQIAREIGESEYSPDEILEKYEPILSPELLIEIRAAMEKEDDLDKD
ncbi:AAA family ATPase [Paraburkholderia youngii]